MSWRSVREIVTTGFTRSPVVMMNEAHNGWARCIRTRRVGLDAVAAAHEAGCRHLAMEALPNPTVGATFSTSMPEPLIYLAHPDLRALVSHSLALGWTLVGYEQMLLRDDASDQTTMAATNRREQAQADNLASACEQLNGAPLLVWCGNGHLLNASLADWLPMAARFARATSIQPYSIDQTPSISMVPGHRPRVPLTEELAVTLERFGGTAGYTADAPPVGLPPPDHCDSFVISTDNTMSEPAEPPAPLAGDTHPR